MRPGEDCLGCHSAGGSASGKTFSAAGTVTDGAGHGVSGVAVIITDSAQQVRTATSNSVGNFFFQESLAPPLTVKLTQGATTRQMASPAPSGACNSCHRVGGTPGPISFP